MVVNTFCSGRKNLMGFEFGDLDVGLAGWFWDSRANRTGHCQIGDGFQVAAMVTRCCAPAANWSGTGLSWVIYFGMLASAS
jgi:hypothetical protein